MSLVAPSPLIHRPDIGSHEKENSDTLGQFDPSSPVKTGRTLRPRPKKSFHPSTTSAVLPSLRLKSPYERPRRATARPKTHAQRSNGVTDGLTKANDSLALSSLRNMSITAEKTKARLQVDVGATSPDGGKGRKRKAPPASLTISGYRPQRPLPVVPQSFHMQPVHQIPLPNDFGLGQPPLNNIGAPSGSTHSFPSVPGFSYGVPTASNPTLMSQVPQTTKLQVPLRLPRPPIAEVQQSRVLKSDSTAGDSIMDVRKKLQSVSKDLLRTAFLYRPTEPDHMQAPNSSSTISGTFASSSRLPTIQENDSPDISRDTISTGTVIEDEAQKQAARAGPYDLTFDQNIGFGLPASAADLLDAQEGRGWFELAGKEPDCCLAVRSSRRRPEGCSEEELKEYYGKIIPAHHLVYAANCANFPARPGPALDESGFPLPMTSILRSHPAENDQQQATLRTGTKLPMVHLAIPFPAQFMIIHQYLYLGDPARLLFSLLALPPPIDLPGQSAAKTPLERMSTLPLNVIVERLKNIHKVWSNVVALGIKDEMLWRAMERAWTVAIQATQTRAKQTPPTRPEQTFMTVPMMDPSMSFGGGSIPRLWRIPSQSDFTQQYHMSGLPVPPLPNHPRSAGIQSTGHVMGIPSFENGPCGY